MIVLRQIAKLSLFLLFTILVIPIQVIIKAICPTHKYVVERFWHKNALRICGISVQSDGLVEHGKVVFLSNHISYLDIAVLGSVIDACFVSKKEVKNWPLFGILARLQDTVFIDRARTRGAIEKSRKNLQTVLNDGHRLIVFPEGTNSIGNTVLPFKRALLSDLSAPSYKAQPVSIKVLSVDGVAPETIDDFEVFGWGDIDFMPHFWRLLGYRTINVRVQILESFDISDDLLTFDDIQRAENVIRQSLDLDTKTQQNISDALVAQQDRATVS